MTMPLRNILLVLVAMATQVTAEAQAPTRSLQGLLKEFIQRHLADSKRVFQEIAPKFEDTDWSNDTDSATALRAVPCNQLCGVCFQWGANEAATRKCETHCVDRCRWQYRGEAGNNKNKRGLLDVCLGFPEGLSVSFGGLGDLLGNIPIIGSLLG